MKVVSDSGPIISFARAGHLNLLQKVVNELWIPKAVYEEIVVKGIGRSGAFEVQQEKWIKRRILDKPKLSLFPSELGIGEKEAMILAEKLKGVLLIDDKRARLEAERRGIETMGTLRIIKEAKDKAFINEAKPVIDKLRNESLRLKDSLYYQFLKALNELE
ncbi:MAG: DUF3368 domain-containing protein [bacterium]